ncbi:hypothetical protein T440DRAFT_306001 [Plenodomus tracheiphilus IPT5]|uniref:Uncharacterized protein n=1 Tax=Plenodomus tracheiphilus IPT5 TaxID=1408161 RepID=A0A6A7BD52_9PLEO|nr:hypothetical protein T440DRAFT_306001 [Plenodomus tracheiphilus IPT5]
MTNPPGPEVAWNSPQAVPSLAFRAIETARRQTLCLYACARPNNNHQMWHIRPPHDPTIRARVKYLYNDLTQTNQQRVSLTRDISALVGRIDLAISIVPNDVRHETAETMLLDVYNRVLVLYDARLSYIHDAGQTRLDVWDQLMETSLQQKQVACHSTLEWMELDYMHRKVDFVREVSSILDKSDHARAKALLTELAGAYPQLWTKAENGDNVLRM